MVIQFRCPPVLTLDRVLLFLFIQRLLLFIVFCCNCYLLALFSPMLLLFFSSHSFKGSFVCLSLSLASYYSILYSIRRSNLIHLQALQRSKLRTTRLHEALHDIRHGAVRCEDIEAWLAQMHQLLTSRDGVGIPQDEKALLALISEQSVSEQQ